jgi:ankyrin repeat protein
MTMNLLYNICTFLQAKDKHGITALLAAIWEGHTDCVKLLLEKVNLVNVNSILFKLQAQNSQRKIFSICVCSQGASRDGKTPDGSSYLEAAEKDEIKALLK